MTEEQLHAACFQWHWNTYPDERQMLWHNNNNSVNSIAGARMKALGVVKGVADFTFLLCGSAVFIELKTDDGKHKPEQIEFARKVMMRGYKYFTVRSLEDFKNLIIMLYESLGIS